MKQHRLLVISYSFIAQFNSAFLNFYNLSIDNHEISCYYTFFSLKKEDYNQNRERTNYTIFAIPLTKLCPFK